MNKYTKITASIGPKCEDKETLTRMISAGVNMCRLNFSHDTGDVQGHKIDLIREISNENGYLFYPYNDEIYLVGYIGTNTEIVLPNDTYIQNIHFTYGTEFTEYSAQNITVTSTGIEYYNQARIYMGMYGKDFPSHYRSYEQ